MEIVRLDRQRWREAAELLTWRHRQERLLHPGLPSRFEQAEHTGKVIEALGEADGAYGIAAVDGTRLAGYMIGRVREDPLRERHLWIDYGGMAVAPGENAELYRDMYAALSLYGVEKGAFKHYALVPAEDSGAVSAWFRSGFGCEQVHGLQPVTGLPELAPPEGVSFRLACPADEEAVRRLAPLIMEHQRQSPVWAYSLPGDREKLQNGYVGLLDDPSAVFWLACQGREAIGFQLFFLPDAPDAADLLTPECCVSLAVGATVGAARGMGIAGALVRHGLNHAAAQHGACWCSADWRATNLEASRFWPKQGFRPVALRLFRQIDGRFRP